MNIVEFIEARIAEDEQIARAARPGPWIDERDGFRIGPKIGSGYLMVPESELAPCEDYIPVDDAAHIARHDPARVLRQCEGLRDAVAAVQDLFEEGWSEDDAAGMTIGALSSMAAIWSDHPDYQQEWATT